MSLAKAEELKRQYDDCKAELEKLKTVFKDFGKSLLPFDINAFYQRLHQMMVKITYRVVEKMLPLLDVLIDQCHQIIESQVTKKRSEYLWEGLGRWTSRRLDFDFSSPELRREEDELVKAIIKAVEGLQSIKDQAILEKSAFFVKDPPEASPVPGHIYVHSKVIIIDECFAIVGSANLNERSMYHDSEVAVSFCSNASTAPPAALRKELFNNILKDKMPKEWEGEKLFEYFAEQLSVNEEMQAGDILSHILPFTPSEGGGTFMGS